MSETYFPEPYPKLCFTHVSDHVWPFPDEYSNYFDVYMSTIIFAYCPIYRWGPVQYGSYLPALGPPPYASLSKKLSGSMAVSKRLPGGTWKKMGHLEKHRHWETWTEFVKEY